MKHPHVEQLRRELAAEGYSQGYVQQLCGELEDHYLTLAEELSASDQEEASAHIAQTAEQRLGDLQAVRAAVRANRDLLPIPTRHPVAMFVALPGLLAIVSVVLLVLGARWVTGQASFPGRVWLIENFELITGGGLALMAGMFTWVGLQYRVGLGLVCLSALLLAGVGMQDIDVAACAASQGGFFESNWGFSSWRALGPWFGLLVVLVAVWGGRRRSVTSHSNASARLPVVGTAACLIVLGGVFCVAVYQVQAATQVHPVDTLLVRLNTPGHLRAIELSLLERGRSTNRYALDAQQDSVLRDLLADYKEVTNRIAREARKGKPKYYLVDQALFTKPIQETHQAVQEVLGAEQRTQLRTEAYRQLGWDIVFREEVRVRLQIGNRQNRHLKDCKLEHLGRRQNLLSEWHRVADSDKAESVARLEREGERYRAEMRSLMNERQLEHLAHLRGDPAGRTASRGAAEATRGQTVGK